MSKRLTNDQISFIKEFYQEKGSKYCSDILGISKSSVSSVAHRNSLRVNRDVLIKNMSKSIIDVNDYISVTDPSIAYILGLIWTDGHVSYANNKSKTPIVKHCCVKYDSESSDYIFSNLKWRNFKSENLKSIGKNTMSTSWISSRELGNYLIDNNFKDKEKGTKIYLNFMKLLSHFLRGLFDGDGCITISDCGKKYKQIAIYFSSSSNQDWSYLMDILDLIDVRYKLRNISDVRGGSSQLCVTDSKSIYNICEFMYKDSVGIRLERKYNKYKEFLEYKKIFIRNNKLRLFLDVT